MKSVWVLEAKNIRDGFLRKKQNKTHLRIRFTNKVMKEDYIKQQIPLWQTNPFYVFVWTEVFSITLFVWTFKINYLYVFKWTGRSLRAILFKMLCCLLCIFVCSVTTHYSHHAQTNKQINKNSFYVETLLLFPGVVRARTSFCPPVFITAVWTSYLLIFTYRVLIRSGILRRYLLR